MPGRTRLRSDHGQPMLTRMPRQVARRERADHLQHAGVGAAKGYKVGGTAIRIKCEDLDALLVDYPQAQR